MRASTISSPRCRRRKRKAIRKERAAALAGLDDRRISPARDITRGALGRLLGLLPGHRRAQMGPALSDPRLLLAARRADGGPGAADPRLARRRADRRRAQPDRRATRSTAAIGAASRRCRSSISSSAIIRRSTRRSRAASSRVEAGRAGRAQARPRLSRRCRPGRRTISPIPAFARAVADFLAARAAGGRARNRGARRNGAVPEELTACPARRPAYGRRREQGERRCANGWRC